MGVRNELQEIKYRLLKLIHKISFYDSALVEEITELIAKIDDLLQEIVEVY